MLRCSHSPAVLFVPSVSEVNTHKVARNHTVHKLQHTDCHEEDEESVEQLHPLRRLVDVFVPDSQADVLQVLRVAHLAIVATAAAGRRRGGLVGGTSGLAGG
jgi:hypothetical protein